MEQGWCRILRFAPCSKEPGAGVAVIGADTNTSWRKTTDAGAPRLAENGSSTTQCRWTAESLLQYPYVGRSCLQCSNSQHRIRHRNRDRYLRGQEDPPVPTLPSLPLSHGSLIAYIPGGCPPPLFYKASPLRLVFLLTILLEYATHPCAWWIPRAKRERHWP